MTVVSRLSEKELDTNHSYVGVVLTIIKLLLIFSLNPSLYIILISFLMEKNYNYIKWEWDRQLVF